MDQLRHPPPPPVQCGQFTAAAAGYKLLLGINNNVPNIPPTCSSLPHQPTTFISDSTLSPNPRPPRSSSLRFDNNFDSRESKSAITSEVVCTTSLKRKIDTHCPRGDVDLNLSLGVEQPGSSFSVCPTNMEKKKKKKKLEDDRRYIDDDDDDSLSLSLGCLNVGKKVVRSKEVEEEDDDVINGGFVRASTLDLTL